MSYASELSVHRSNLNSKKFWRYPQRRIEMRLSALPLVLTGVAFAQQSPPLPVKPATDETLIMGTTTLKLGMARQYVLAALGLQYDVISQHPPDLSSYSVRVGSKPDSDLVGRLYFDKKGTLEHAVKHLTPNQQRHATDGEIGRVLFSIIGRLPNGGACSFMTVNGKSAEYNGAPEGKMQWREAYIECGHKRFAFNTTTLDGDDSLDITEEIDVQGTLQRQGVNPAELRPVPPTPQ
jgi:hypothetical protein